MSKGGSVLEDVGRLLAPQTTQGFLNAPLERQTRARAMDQGSALDQLIQGLSGNQPAQNINVNGQNVAVPPLKMSTQAGGPGGSVVGLPNATALTGGFAPNSGLGQFMQDQVPGLAMRADPETALKALQSSLIDTPKDVTLKPGEHFGTVTRAGGFKELTAIPDKSTLLTPEEENQKIRIAHASREPSVTWRDMTPDEVKASGMPSGAVAQVNNRGERRIVSANGAGFTPEMGNLLGSLAEIGVTLPAGMRSRDQQVSLLGGILARNPDKSPSEIAQMIKGGQINFGAEKKATADTVTAFDKGKQGDSIRSFNVGIAHLGTLGELADSLDNGDIQLFNKIGNRVATETGKEAPTNFDAAKAIVGDEIIKAIVGGGGALADRENAQNQISNAKSPKQLSGVIKTYKKLMAGQLVGLKKQYESSTGFTNFNEKLLPQTIKELESEAMPGAPSGDAQPIDALVDKYRTRK